MKVLFDTNIILDILLDRQPFSEPASILLSKVERSEMDGFLCATTITTIHYLLSRHLNKEQAVSGINSIMALFAIASVNRLVIEDAIKAKTPDFEDSVLHEAARHASVEYIITRNIKDFKKAKIPVFTPVEFLNMLESLS